MDIYYPLLVCSEYFIRSTIQMYVNYKRYGNLSNFDFLLFYFVIFSCWHLALACLMRHSDLKALDTLQSISVQLVQTVEGLYCKRPIQCLASSEILTPPPPHRPPNVYPPPLARGGGHTRWVGSQ
jgi:hypothetical protein